MVAENPQKLELGALLGIESSSQQGTVESDQILRQIAPLLSRLVHRLPHSHTVDAVIFTPDGKLVATAGLSSMIHLWSTETGRLVRDIETEDRVTESLVFSPDGTTLFSAGKAVNQWETATGRLLKTLEIPDLATNSMAVFSADARYVATMNRSEQARLWDLSTGALLPSRSSRQRTA